MSEAKPDGGKAGVGLTVLDIDAAIFDLDGVVTRTAAVHAAAWKRLFDEYLSGRSERTGEPFQPFDIDNDYRRHIDGKPRYDGVADFLESRGISLPRGEPSDAPDRETVCGLGNQKNRRFRESIERDGVEVFDGSVALVRQLRALGVKTALASSSRNARAVLAAASISDLFDVCVDGNDLAELGLAGKPRPDLFLAAADRLGVDPGRTVVFEDAISGVQAGRAGGFKPVVAVDRSDQAAELSDAGADLVLPDLAALHLDTGSASAPLAGTPAMLERPAVLERWLEGKDPAVFLDYDGTLTPIVDRPELAILSGEMRATVKSLAGLCTVGIISGRDRADVEKLVGLDGLIYAGSHGFDISGPNGLRIEHEDGEAFVAAIERATASLREALASIKGAIVEAKRFAVAVHYRQVAEADAPAVEAAVDRVVAASSELRKTYGKKVFEIRPRLDWDKGKAVLWVLEALGLNRPDVLPFYLGDDTTDEDAFVVLAERGIGILVGHPVGETAARYQLDDPADVQRFLGSLVATLKDRSHG